MLLSPQWQLASPLCRRRDEARRGHTAGTWQTRGPGLAIALRQEACGRECAGEGRRVRARCRPGPRFRFPSRRGARPKVPAQGAQSLHLASSLVGFLFLTNSTLMPHSFHSFRFWGRPQLSRLISPYLDSTSPGWSVRGVEEGRGEEPHQGGFSEIKPLFKTRRPRAPGMQAGARGFPAGSAGCLGQGLLGEGAGVPRCSSRSSSFPGQGKHILSTRRATAPGRRVGNWIAPSPTRTAAEEPGKNPEGKGCERATALEGDPDHPRRALLCISLGALGSRHFLAMS